ncbi:MAG: phosphoesterase PA-phosphatase related protein [Solirubrobacterales bacterium]|nr:phosphoesterase PA-phosphatase related protein [Solirubrobacterales bacterium]
MARSDALRPAPAPGRRALAQRLLVLGAPVVYLIALGLTIAYWGLPVARDQLFFWLALGMLAFSVTRWRTWGVLALEWAPFFGLLVLYDRLRGAVAVTPEQAHQTAQIDVDRALFGHEIPTVGLQRQLWDSAHLHWYDYLVWATYMTHFFAVWTVAAVLWRVAHDRFRAFAATTVVLTLGAFLTYWLFPAQPPWLAAQDGGGIGPVARIVPEVWGRLGVRTIQSVYENADYVNPVAAMPSLHAAFPFMLLLSFWSAGWRVRVPLALYTLLMGFALVYGGEHYVMDILAGWLMAGAAFALVHRGVPASHRWMKRAPTLTADSA